GNAEGRAAVERGLALVLKELNDPRMAPSTEPRYDVRVWGHACALEFLCNARAAKAAGKYAAAVDAWIPKLIATLVTEESTGGGSALHAVLASSRALPKRGDELEERRQKRGTHSGDYKIAPYFFYYGHRYAAQATEMLPKKDRPVERAKLLEVILKTRDPDGTWNDRVFERSRTYGTAMGVRE